MNRLRLVVLAVAVLRVHVLVLGLGRRPFDLGLVVQDLAIRRPDEAEDLFDVLLERDLPEREPGPGGG